MKLKILLLVDLLILIFIKNSIADTIGFVSDTVCFGDSTSLNTITDIPENTISLYEWDLDYDGQYNDAIGKTIKYLFKNAGTHPVKVRLTVNGKYKIMADPINIFVKPLPLPDFEVNYFCKGQASLIKNLSNPNDSMANYYWDMNNDGNSEFNYNDNFTFIFPDTINTVKLTITNNYGCSASKVREVNINNVPVADFYVKDGKCTGDTIYFLNTSSILGQNGSKYIWKFGDSNIDVENENPYHIYLKSGNYNVRMVAISAQNCSDTITKNINIVTGNKLELRANKDTLYINESAILEANGEFVDYLWSTGETTKQIMVSEEGIYYVKAIDNKGCVSSGTISITAIKDYNPNKIIAINGIITPNNDGINDFLEFLNIEAYGDNELIIYDQWGAIVQRLKNYKNNWDGKNYKGEFLETGSYYYVIKTKNIISKGNINILR
jgi:gliding motility-associated-like protein